MGMCLDNEDCAYQNLDSARFCAKCGIPLQRSLLLGRYEIQALIGKDRSTITLSAIDLQEEKYVTIRALQPNITNVEERDIFLQDAELAYALSGRIIESGSIRVIEYGQDGLITFLVKSETPISVTNEALSLAPIKQDGRNYLPNYRLAGSGQDGYIDSEDDATEPREIIFKESQQPPVDTPWADSQLEASDQLHATESQPGKLKAEINWVEEGHQAYQNTKYEEALTAYDEALANDPLSVEAWNGKGTALLHLGFIEEALQAYDQALSLHPNDPDLWNSRAHVLHELHRYDEEMYCYDQALALDPNYVFAWSGRGITLVEQNRHEEALLDFDR
ncbi:MAG TPA: tetratricopeptide repeat protein, partial [Ktedonobacteraceae bacterium]|nr:tetratricopeptide repeat protein [Ktedonobacteraceae bacterium]